MTTILKAQQLNDNKLGLSVDQASAATTAFGADERGFLVDIQAHTATEVEIHGFVADGRTYAISVTRSDGTPDPEWQTDGIKAVATALPLGDHAVIVIATAGGSTTSRKLSTGSIKIRQPGKPDPFLAQFPVR